MNFIRIYAIFIRQMFLFRHNFIRLFSIFLWVGLDIIIWGFLTRYLNLIGKSGFSFVPVLLGAVVFWNFLVHSQQGVMRPFLEDVWARNFINIFGSPLTIKEYAFGLILSSIVTSAAGLFVMVSLAGIFFGYTFFKLGLLLLPFLFILSLSGLALGIFTVALVLRFGPSVEWLAWPIPFIVSPLAGVFYPISVLPKFLQIISRIVPPSYVFEGMRSVIFTGKLSLFSLGIGGVLALVYLVIMYFFFVYVYRIVLRKGLIARFTAEDI